MCGGGGGLALGSFFSSFIAKYSMLYTCVSCVSLCRCVYNMMCMQ